MDKSLRCRRRDHRKRPLLGGTIAEGVVALLLSLAAPAGAAPPLGDLTIPANRVPDWYLPTPVDTSGWTVTPVHAANCADNTTEDATVIRNAISAASANTILQLDSGCTYNIQAGIIVLNKSNVVIRGGGMGSTILHWGHPTGGTDCYIPPPNSFGSGMGGEALMWICTNAATDAAVNWTAGFTRGTTDITVASDSTFSAGDWIGLLSGFPSELRVGNDAHAGNGAMHMYLAKIAVKRPGGTANVLRLDRPLRDDCSNAASFQQVVYKWHPVENSGIESLTLKPYSVDVSSEILRFSNAASVWATDMRIDGADSTGVFLAKTARSIMSRIYLNNQTNTPYGGAAFTFGPGAVDNVVMDSIFVRNPVDVKLESGSSGNAWIYNYQRRNSVPRNCDGTRGDGLAKAERAIFFHGLANESLIEGNDTECQLELDNYWGSEAYRNTIYRNRQGVVTMGGSITQGWGFSTGDYNTSPNSFYTNVMLNTVTRLYHGDAGINSNFDIVDNVTGTFNLWVERNLIKGALNLIPRSDTTNVGNVASANGPVSWSGFSAPASLIYTSKPSWWTIASPWPGIGADVDTIGGTMHKLPAQCRYEGSTTGDCATAPALPGVPGRPYLIP